MFKYAIVIFVHNEEDNISKCINSVLSCISNKMEDKISIYILANGCEDNSIRIISSFMKKYPIINLIKIDLADKCNAWNYFLYNFLDEDKVIHFFMDGDVTISNNAFEFMYKRLLTKHNAHIIAGCPMSGRNKRKYRFYIKEYGWIFANLYGVKTTSLVKVREKNIRLPIGFLGDDHLITKIFLSNIGEINSSDKNYMTYTKDAGYIFQSLSPFRKKDIIIYFNRIKRYALRAKQIEMLKEYPLTELPYSIEDINIDLLSIYKNKWYFKFKSFNDFFSYLKLKEIHNNRVD